MHYLRTEAWHQARMQALARSQRGYIINPGRYVTASGGTDPHFANVVSLCHFDGTPDDFTTDNVVDQIPARTWTGAGQSINCGVLKSAHKVFGPTSLLKTSAVASQHTCPDHADWNFGNGDFTLEGRNRFTAIPAAFPFIFCKPVAANFSPWAIYLDGPNSNLLFASSSNGSAWDICVGQLIGAVVIDTWYGWSVSRVGTNIYLSLDGTLTTTVGVGTASVYSGADVVRISGLGAGGAGTNFTDGYYDEFRATKGVGRYNANYTLDTAAFPDS